jgi:hypothetical protein
MSTARSLRIALLIAFSVSASSRIFAQPAPVYQRYARSPAGWSNRSSSANNSEFHSFRGFHGVGKNFRPHGGSRQSPENGFGFSFQRPYPYHLDYYRMRYGGSYEPYHGFLYGTPRVFAPHAGVYAPQVGTAPDPYFMPFDSFAPQSNGSSTVESVETPAAEPKPR